MKSKCILFFVFTICLSTAWAQDERSIRGLRNALVALAPGVDPHEAEQLSVTAHTMSRSLAREWGVGNPSVQNYLINIRKRKYGYCADYTRLIGERLREFNLKTLVLHWGAAYAKEPDESNCLVITARNQPFLDGIVVDGWRYGGRLFWCPVKKDHDYEHEYYTALNQLGARSHSGITAWKEDLKETAWLQQDSPGKAPPKGKR